MKKKKLVIIAGILYPNPSAIGKFAVQCIEMLKNNFDVSVIYIRSIGKKHNGNIIDNVTYFNVTGLRWETEIFFQKSNIPIMVKLCKAIGWVQRFFSVNGNLNWFYKEAYKNLIEITTDEPIEIIFSICNPFQAHLAGLKYKNLNPNVRFVTCTIDPFAKGNQFSGSKLNKAEKLEKKVYEMADFNFVSEEIFSTEYEKLKEAAYKTDILPYTIVNYHRRIERNIFDTTKINLLYAGNFYRSIRNPEFMLESLLNLNNEKIILHLYSGGDCQETIQKYVKKSNGRIIKHSLEPHDKIIEILNGCDFLISVSNNVKEFQPSKSFEYISLGKPIINFFEGDNQDKIFNRYPHCLQVSKENGNLKHINEFIKYNHKKELQFSEIEEIYKEHTVERFKEKLINGLSSVVV